jgi:hypothetical protein
MMFAARMKKGMAISGKLSIPANIRWGRIDRGMLLKKLKMIKGTAPSDTNIGTVRAREKKRRRKIKTITTRLLSGI